MALWTPYIEECPLDLSKTRNNEIIPAALERPSSIDLIPFNHMDSAREGCHLPVPVLVVQQTGYSHYLEDYSHISANSVLTSPELLELQGCEPESLSDSIVAKPIILIFINH